MFEFYIFVIKKYKIICNDNVNAIICNDNVKTTCMSSVFWGVSGGFSFYRTQEYLTMRKFHNRL